MGARKRVAILGAGASGLAAIKWCNEDNLEPICFERTDHIGGLWYYTSEPVEGQACVNKSTTINTSKEMMSFSDFPVPREFSMFMHNSKVLEYFHLYADCFDLKKSIRFRTEVKTIQRAPNYDQTGQWRLAIQDLKSGQESTEIFDAVLLCTGHHADKYIPHIKGQEEYKGEILHTHDYKDAKEYEGKRVVVVGIGNSAVDAATELARFCSQVYLSTRRGAWVFDRMGEGGTPVDMVFTNRFSNMMAKLLPKGMMSSRMESQVNKRMDHDIYALRPEHSILSAHPTVNGDLPSRIASGSLIIKPNIQKIHPTGVEFEDGSLAEDVDIIMLGTGYTFGFPFLEKGIIDVHENKACLYKYIFPPEHPTIAAIGFIQPIGSTITISEMQCRLATKILKGERSLPSKEEMLLDIREKEKAMKARYISSQRHTIQVDYLDYMDQLADLIGCKPNMKKLLLTDPKFAWMVLFDAAPSYHYRIHGPNSWPGARQAIMTMWDRTIFPLKTRKTAREEDKSGSFFMILIIVVLFAVLWRIFM